MFWGAFANYSMEKRSKRNKRLSSCMYYINRLSYSTVCVLRNPLKYSKWFVKCTCVWGSDIALCHLVFLLPKLEWYGLTWYQKYPDMITFRYSMSGNYPPWGSDIALCHLVFLLPKLEWYGLTWYQKYPDMITFRYSMSGNYPPESFNSTAIVEKSIKKRVQLHGNALTDAIKGTTEWMTILKSKQKIDNF